MKCVGYELGRIDDPAKWLRPLDLVKVIGASAG
jgi:hypothetical protein